MCCCSKEFCDYANGGFLHDPDITLEEFNYHAYGSSTPPSTFEPLMFPEREGMVVQRRRTREQIHRLISEL